MENKAFTGLFSFNNTHPAITASVKRSAPIMYNRTSIYRLRNSVNGYNGSIPSFGDLKTLGLLNYRGCRGGRNKQRPISTLIRRTPFTAEGTTCKPLTHRRRSTCVHGLLDNPQWNSGQRIYQPTSAKASTNQDNTSSAVRQLINRPDCALLPIPLQSVSTKPSNVPTVRPAYPRIYVLNAASLAKPHAIEQLQTELDSFSIDIAFISETHFKSKHKSDAFNISGYQIIRRDRNGRKGGGVALITKIGLNASAIVVANDITDYETLWVSVDFYNAPFTCCVVYHPPKPIYKVEQFIDFLSATIDHLLNISN